MKTKVFVQILILAILGTSIVQAQENIDMTIKKEMRSAKREIRKARKDIKKSMKDVDWEVIHIDDSRLEHIIESPAWISDEVTSICEDNLTELEDLLVDLDDNLVHIHEISNIKPLEHFEFEVPSIHFEAPDIDLRTPETYFIRDFFEERGNVLELSKDLEDVSISKDFYFDVKEGQTTLDMDVDGSLSAGELKITVKKPDGEVFQLFHISPLANVDWSQQLNLDEANDTYAGKWTINLSGSAATGSYQLRFKAK